MQKHLQKLLLLLAFLVPWMANAQTLSEYEFSTGTDASKWITLSSPTSIMGTNQDDVASSVYNLGITFPFGVGTYSQFSVSSNGIFKLGPGAASSSTTAGQFTSSYYNTSLPKICGVARDIGTCSNGYIRYQLMGTAPNRVFVCEYCMGYTYSASSADVKWQVQLHEADGKVVIVYGPSAPSTTPSSFQTGLAEVSNDILIINPSTHALIYSNGAYSTTYSTWHGANRYYQFERPNISCPRPNSLTVTNASETSFDLTWHQDSTCSEWMVELCSGSQSQGNGTLQTVYDTTVSFTGLTANTMYTVYVAALCSNGDTSGWAQTSFRTPCTPYAVPFSETFETFSTSASDPLPSCWDKHTNYSSNYPYASTSYGHNGSTRSMYMYSTNTTYTYMVLPMFAPAIDSLQVSFWLQKTNTSYAHNLQVGVMNNPADVSTFVPVASVQCTNLYQWEFKEVPLSSYTGSGRFIAIMSPDGVYSYPYLDDLSVTYIPSCHHPYNINVSNITTTSAEVSWLDSVSAGQYVLTYSDGSFSDVETATSSPITLTGLTPNTTYNYTLVSVCNATDSSFAMSGSFTTECIPMDSLPYLMTFESAPTGGSSNYTFVSCWHRLNNGTAYFGYPYVSSSSSYNHTPGGNKGLYWYNPTTSGTYGDYQCVVLPSVDTDTYPINNLQLSFWAKSSSTSYFPVLIVGVMTDPYNINTFTAIDTVDVGNSTEWAEYIVTTNRYEGYGQYVAIKAVRPSSSWYVYVDDVELAVAPACPRVEEVSIASLSPNEVTLRWLEMGSSTSWTVEYGPHGFTPGTGTTTTVYDTTVTLSGLNSNTQYDVYITVECSDPTGAGVNNITFRTSCGLLTNYPFVEDFESQMTGTSTTGSPFIPCWQRLNNGTSYGGYPYVSSSSSYNHTTGGTKGLYWYNTTTTGTYGDYQCLVLPGVDTSVYPINALQLRFWAKSSSTSYSPVFQVGVMTDPTNINTFQQVATANVGSNTNWREFITEFSSFTGYGAYIAVKAVRPSSSWYAYVDDFTIETIPTCPEVTAVQAGNIASTSAAVSWALNPGPGEVVSYEVEVEELGMGSPSTYTTTNQVMLIPNLMPQTTYVVRVRANCDLDGFGGADSVTFTTTCLGGGNLPIVGNGTTTTTYYLPLNNYYNYSYTQQIILASEMSGPTTIQGIRFRYNYSSAVTQKSNCTIYIGHTTLSSLSTSSFVDPSTITAVYTGPMNVHNGWNDFIFSTPFSYNGTSNLVIAVDDNSGSYPSSSYVYDAYNCSGTLGMHFYSDSENPNPTSTSTLNSFTGSKSTTTYRVAMEMITPCDPTASCAAPNVIVTRVEGDEVDIEWAPGNFETSWTIDYRTHTGSWITVETNYSSTSYTFTNLVPATTYDFRVRHSCDGTTYSATVSALTPCLPVPVPFFEDFESFSTTTTDPLPVCWMKNTNYSTPNYYPYASTSYSHSGGSKSMYMYSTSSCWSYMVLPLFQPAIDSLQVSFWLYKSNTSYAHSLEVGVMTDPTDVNTFTLVATVTPSMLTTWEVFDVPLSSYNGNGQYIAIMSPNGVYCYPYLDDLTVDYIPPCPRLSDLTAGYVSTNEASVYWTQMSDATDYLVEYGVHGFPLGYGTQQSTTGDSIRLYSLAAMTTYDVYVSAICAMGDTSEPRLIMVTTPCGEIATLPFRQDFETCPTGSSSSNTWVDCWHRLNNGTSYYGYPYVSSSSSYNHTSGGTKGLYWYASTTTGTYGDYHCVVLPPIDTTVLDVADLQLSFWAKSSSTSYNPVFQVGVMSDPTDINSFQQVGTVNVGGNTTWTEYTTTFESFTGTGNYLAVKAVRPTSTWYAYVDDFKLEVAPDCPPVSFMTVSEITTMSADVSWYENGSATSWTVEYGPSGFVQGTGIQFTTTSNPVTLSGLTANTAYDVYVTVDCTDGVGGTNMVSFRTDCDPIPHEALPYIEDFERYTASTTGTIDPCWRKGYMGVSDYYPYVSSSYHASGTKSLYFYGYNTSYYCYAALPLFEDSLSNLIVHFKLLKTSATYGSITVGIMTNTADVNTFHPITTVMPEAISAWESFSVPLGSYHGSGHITFMQNSTYYTYLDDVVVDVLPDCPPVSHVNVSSVGTTSALLGWTVQHGVSNNVPEEFEIEVYDNMTNTPIVSTTDTNYYFFITGLQPLSSYTAKVRASCGADGYGPWDSVTFQTPCPLGGSVPIVGNGTTTTTYYLPLNNFYNYSYSQEIILSSEMNGPTTIYGIRFRYNYSTAVSNKSNCTIYVGHTTLSSISTSNFVDPSTLTAVYTGPMNVHNGWNEFTFSTPFAYDGSSNLVIAVDDNSGSYPGSSYIYDAYNTSGTLSMLYYSDSENPDPTSTSTLTAYTATKTTYTYRAAMELVMPCDSNPSCVPPNVVVLSTDTTNATVVWGAGMDETSWLLEYRPATASSWTTIGYETSNSYTFTGLVPNTEYQVRVTSICVDTDMASVATFRTSCAPFAVPFHENFASFPTNGSDPLPSCWNKHTNYSTNYPYASTSYSISGGRSMYMYSSNTSYSYLTLPPFSVPFDSLQVSFWLYKTNTSYNHEIWVGVMTDPDDVSTFELVEVAQPSALSTWEPFEIPLNNYHGQGQYITLMSPNAQYSYPYLDELSVEYISPCPRVRNVTSSNIGLHSAKISWDTTSASSYELEYGPAGFTPGTGTRMTGLVDDTLTIFGLSASTQYDVYVRGLCMPDTSNWSFGHTFFTQCGLIDSVPFFQNFNSIGTSTSVHSPQCWYGTSTYSTSYPYPSSSYSRSGGGAAMYMYLSNTSGYYTMLQLPPVDTTVLPINSLQISFSLLRSTTSYMHGVVVGVCTGQGMQNFTPIDTVVVSAATGVWQDFELAFNNYTGYGNYITFLAYAGTESTCYPYLDDILLELIPSCIRPDSLYSSNATSSMVTLGWRERGTATAWEVEYGPAGFTPGTGTGTTVLASTNPTTLVGLPASYEGDFYVRSICTPGDTSLFSREACRFSTSQLPASIPYHYNFEDSTEWAAWQTSTNTYIDWARGTAEVDSGNYAMYISPDGGLTYGNENFSSVVNAAIFRDVDFGTIDTSFTFTYRAKVGGSTSARYDALMVFLVDPAIAAVPSSSNITSPWGNVNDLYRISVAYLDTTWSTYTASFDTIHGVKRVAFFWFNQSTGASYPYIGGPAAVDNIHITYSACPRPLNMSVSNVTSSAATLHWDGDPTASYRVAYRVSGASASTNVYVNVNTNTLTLTGLSSTTAYVAWVQKLCGADSSLFSDGVEFQTELCDNAVTAYSYDPAWTQSTSTYAPIGYSFYNYSYVQTLIDSAQMVGLEGAPITAFAFNPSVTNQGDYYNHMDVYMANVPESDLSSGFIMPNTTNHVFIPVITDGDFRYTTTGWQLHGFDSAFTWDGHSNVLFVINRRHGSYSSGATFHAHSTTTVKTRYLYQDGSAYDPTTVTGGTTLNLVGDLSFVSCGVVPVCHEPIITGTTHTYENATVTWTGNGTAYEVNIKESIAPDFTAADIPVVGTSHTFYGLQPATSYTVRVRQDCNVDSLGYSEWVTATFITDSLPCLPPDSLTVSDITNTNATFDWVPFGYETMWDVHVWNTAGFDTTYTVSSHPVTLGGYTAGVSYNASVRPLCGSAHNILGDWGDTVTFTAATCPDVTGLSAGSVQPTSLTLSWNNNPAADTWVIEYGFTGFEQGTGTQAVATTPTYVVTGLLEETSYDFYVRAMCGTDWYSENWAYVSATTPYGGVICDAPTGVSAVVAANAATVSWTAGEGNISYELEYGTHGFAHGTGTTQTATSSPITISNLNYETQYDVYVRAFCEQNASSAWSIVTSFTTEAQGSEDCDPVSNLTATEITENSAVVSWTAGATGSEWEVVLTNASGATLSEARTHEQRYQLNGLTPGTSYIVKVRTVCGDDQYSSFVSTNFTTIAVGIDRVTEATCTIYPNPTSSATTISVSGVSGKVKIAVVDMNGRTVASELLECSSDCTKTMDVERLAQGAYFVRITGENVNMVKKLIVR